jgi:predicted enzyme related to lactoylglutathione lyase
MWQPRQHIGAELVNVPGTVVWNELASRDLDGGTAFYTEVFGLRWDDYDTGGQGPRYRVGATSAGTAAGALEMGDQFPAQVPANWGVYFAVEDASAAVAKATELDGTVQVPVFDTPQGETAVLRDPQGGVFSVIAMRAADD